MGFNKCIIHDEEYIRKMIQENGSEFVAKNFLRCDCFIGNSEGIELVVETIEKYLSKK
jgi:hypothetical protein